ncbi:hypothetical protein DK847_00750 [Aestuariivirga litoralis]|uniref:CAAX prenyl protease 2/Lysostaphin resistance protein A-like domain-containing protein n=1 Tax=Aestuariivirga litoralis TaxID=2650924 RepID=A0A2W2AST1_9HYPH|nr:CPBP family intramembrane glutamic endopeptidase [Aestuariivirga litoralis]PZF78385.1 hypothetical protein DK847_00750 [Aestuariivirga litoralis]
MGESRATLKQAVLAALGYIAIMAVGMFTTGHVFGYEYGTTEMVLVLAPFEVALSLYAIVMARRLFGGWDCGFHPLDARGLAWMVPSFAVIAALFLALFATGTPTVSLVALVLVATNLLIGFSEELMFRGVALRGALTALSTGKAILLSSVLFALLHAVNVLALMPVEAMVQQLGLTFVFGFAMACFALRANSLLPVIAFHILWDMVQFLGGLWQADFGNLVIIGIIVSPVVAAGLWWAVLRKREQGRAA